MPFTIEQHGFDEQGQRLRLIAGGINNLDPLLNVIASDLAQMWRDNIDAGPNDRWQAGPSYRAETFGGTTLHDRGLMQASIIGQQTGPSPAGLRRLHLTPDGTRIGIGIGARARRSSFWNER